MKRVLCLFMIMAILLTGCTSLQIEDTASTEQLEQYEQQELSPESITYRTILSPNNELSIVRRPGVTDYSIYHYEKMTEVPKYNPESDELWEVDLRSYDLTGLDLRENFEDLIYADFDSKTKWPKKMTKKFDPKKVMKIGKNPGLGIRNLHKKGITGKGVGIAIIDQGLLVDHVEYKDQLKLYEEIHCMDENATMHGPAVASIAVGKTVGVAPEADLYYIAETHTVFNKDWELEYDISWTAKSIDRIVEINKTLSEGEKIRVISISLGIGDDLNGYEKVFDSIEKARQEGIYTVYVGSDPFGGLGRDPFKNPDDNTSYSKGEFWKNSYYNNNELLVPMDSRGIASPTGTNDYVFYRTSGMSWAVPYVAGLYVLACQVNPGITPEIFWEIALNTGETISLNKNGDKLGRIVNPVKLIEKIKELK